MASSSLRASLKLLAGLLIFSVFFIEWRRGSFKEWKARLRRISWKPYFKGLALLALAAVFMMGADRALSAWVQSQTSVFFDGIIRLGGFLGKGQNGWTVLAAIYFLGYLLPLNRKIIFAKNGE